MVLGVGGESKTLAWGFAMAPHRLRALVYFCFVWEKILSILYFVLAYFIYISKQQSDCAILPGFYFHKTLHSQSFTKIKVLQKFPN